MSPNGRAAGIERFILFLLGTSQLLLPIVVGHPYPAAKHPPCCSLTPRFPHSSTSMMGQRAGRAKARKLVGQEKDSLKCEEEKKKKSSDAKAITCHLSQAD